MSEVTSTAQVLTPEQVAARKAELHGKIQARFDEKTQFIEAKFHYKKTKDEATGAEFKRPTVEFDRFPVPSVLGIVDIIEKENNEKELALLLEAVQEYVLTRARDLLNDNPNLTAENFPYEELTWEKIANLPKSERRGGGISKEVWEDFAKDYIEVMPAVTGKDSEKIGNHVKLLLAKLNPIKTNKPILEFMLTQLTLYINSSPNAETYGECVKFLQDKGKALLELDESALLNNL